MGEDTFFHPPKPHYIPAFGHVKSVARSRNGTHQKPETRNMEAPRSCHLPMGSHMNCGMFANLKAWRRSGRGHIFHPPKTHYIPAFGHVKSVACSRNGTHQKPESRNMAAPRSCNFPMGSYMNCGMCLQPFASEVQTSNYFESRTSVLPKSVIL